MARIASVAGITFVVALWITSSAAGGTLADDPNGIADWQGTRTFDTVYFYGVTYYTADIDYCVYAPGQFAETFTPDLNYEPDQGHYVYAYQIVDVTSSYGGYVNRLSVGLDDDEEAACIWYIAGSGTEDPRNSSFASGTAGWVLNTDVGVGETSSVLYFSSPYGPEWDNATVTGYFSAGDTQDMPSPIPEPGTLLLLAGGAVLSLFRMRRRKVT